MIELFWRLPRALTLRCPHCGRGRMARGLYAFRRACPVCGLVFQADEGDFWGGMVLSYACGGTVALAAAALLFLTGWGTLEQRAYAVAAVALAAVLVSFPFAKALWIHFLYLTRGQYEEYRPPGDPTRADPPS